MFNSVRPVALGLLAVSFLFAQETPEPLTNETIAKMVYAGVPTETIIKTIEVAEAVSFSFLPAQLIGLANAKVPEEVIKAMAARLRQNERKESPVVTPKPPAQPATSPAQPATLLAQPATPPAPPPTAAPTPPRSVNIPAQKFTDWDQELGDVEVSVGGGASAGRDMPARKIAPVLAAGLAVGLSRYLALTGNYAYHALGTADYVVCTNPRSCVVGTVGVRANEFTGGLRVSIPNSTRATPFFTGNIGGLRGSASTRVLGIGIGAAQTIFIGGVGGGVNVHFTKHVGFQYDARVFFGQYDTFYGRMTVGAFFRF